MKKIYSFIVIITISFSLFLICDFFYSNYIIKSSQQTQQKVRVFNEYYHHGFEEKIIKKIEWGGNFYNICTDKNSFLISCETKTFDQVNSNYEILFMGDSMTEGLGYPYEKTFVGIFDKSNNKKVSNLAVLSYSPFLYYQKIKYFLSKGVKFKHLIVFMDISDVQDDLNYKNLNTRLDKKDNPKKVFTKEIEKENIMKISDFLNIHDLKLKNILAKNFLISFKLYTSIKKIYYFEIIDNKDLYIKKISWMDYNTKRVSWSYDKNFKGFSNVGIDSEIENSVSYMKSLYELLQENNIDLSVAVYPLPQSLLYPVKDSRYIKTWEKFCIERCKHFINLFPLFEEEKDFLSTYQKYYIFNDVHFNEYSHNLIGNFLSKKIY